MRQNQKKKKQKKKKGVGEGRKGTFSVLERKPRSNGKVDDFANAK